MTATVHSLEDKRAEREPHVSGEAICLTCHHTWTGVWPTGATELECPQCHSMRGRSRWDVAPDEKRQVWTCRCGNQFMQCLDTHIHCPGCGNGWTYEEMM